MAGKEDCRAFLHGVTGSLSSSWRYVGLLGPQAPLVSLLSEAAADAAEAWLACISSSYISSAFPGYLP